MPTLSDNRLMPPAILACSYRVPKELAGLNQKVGMRYHIQSALRHHIQIKQFGPTANDASNFLLYEWTVPFTGDLAKECEDPSPAPRFAGAAGHG
ncbi:MAG TPA: hypothetical protein VFS39_07725 [Nitrospira sp.]|nr:hypothetical protein [Nitrospira sp.]